MTPYELIQLQTLDRSRNNPVDAYSAGLLDLAKQRAYQRFKQAEATQEQAAALQRTQTAGELRIKEAQATAEGHAKAAIDALNQKEKIALKQEFAALHIAQNKGESDEDYLVRAGQEADKIRAGQLDTTYQSAEQYRNQANAIRRMAEAQRPQRVRDAAFEVIRNQMPPEVIKALSTDTAVRDSQLAVQFQNNSKLKDIKLMYEDALQKANQQVPVLTVDEDTRARGLDYRAAQLESHAASLFTNPKYAGAIPEYTRLLNDRSALGTGATDYNSVVKAAAAKPVSSSAAPARPGLSVPPPTPSELMPFGASVQERGLVPAAMDRIGAIGSRLTAPGEAIATGMESFLRNPARPFYQAGKFLFKGGNAPDVNDVFPMADEIANPAGLDLYLNSLGVPQGFNVSAAARPPTPAEVTAFRQARDARVNRSALPLPADTLFGPVNVPQAFGYPFGTPPPELTPPLYP